MARLADWEINIPLAQVPLQEVGQPDEYFQAVNDAYTGHYLEALGVEPSLRRRKMVQRRAPLDQCNIEASWDDLSAVARSLRITQVPVGRSASAGRLQARSRWSGEPPPPMEPPTSGVDKWRYMEVGPPAPPDAAKAKQQGGDGPTRTQEGERQVALMQMQMADNAASEAVNGDLVEELERMRRAARGDHTSGDADPEVVHWGEEGMREIESLKQRFILPFAAVRQEARGRKGSELVPWQSPEYREHMQVDVTHDHVSELSQPISMTLENILEEAVDYNEGRFPVELLTTRRDPWFFASLRDRLNSPEAVRLTGLLAHLLYWTAFGHLRPPARRLPQASQQSLILTLQELWVQQSEVTKHRRPGPLGERLAKERSAGVCFLLPVFLLSLKRNVESVFRRQYPKAFGDVQTGDELAARLVERLNVLVMNLFDPDCVYANFGALDSSVEAIKAWRKLNVLYMKLGLTPANRMLGREFRTNPLMLLLMNGDSGGPGNPKTRKFLQKSASDAVLATVSAAQPRQPGSGGRGGTGGAAFATQPLPRLDDRRQHVLYRTACSRMKSVGLEVAQQSLPRSSSASSGLLLATSGAPQPASTAAAVGTGSLGDLVAAAGSAAGRTAARG